VEEGCVDLDPLSRPQTAECDGTGEPETTGTTCSCSMDSFVTRLRQTSWHRCVGCLPADFGVLPPVLIPPMVHLQTAYPSKSWHMPAHHQRSPQPGFSLQPVLGAPRSWLQFPGRPRGGPRLDFWLTGCTSREGVTPHWGCPPLHPRRDYLVFEASSACASVWLVASQRSVSSIEPSALFTGALAPPPPYHPYLS